MLPNLLKDTFVLSFLPLLVLMYGLLLLLNVLLPMFVFYSVLPCTGRNGFREYYFSSHQPSLTLRPCGVIMPYAGS